MPPRVVALADDLTGALEAGARLAAYSEDVIVSLVNTVGSAEVQIIDTETRHLSEEGASSYVFGIARAARECAAQFLYKKTDSTLRGHVGAELDAVMRAWPGLPLLYAPGYPEMGRTVKDGVLYVDGLRVAETEFARDGLNPIRESSIRRLLERWPSSSRVVVHEGDASERVGEFVLTAGPAPVASAIGRFAFGPEVPRVVPRASRCVVVNGSRHSRSIEQARFADDVGWTVIEHKGSGLSEADVSMDLARRALEVDWDALVVFGGDTAVAVLRALGETRVCPITEILPGVPVSRIGNRLLITKAGGFGPIDILARLRTLLAS